MIHELRLLEFAPSDYPEVTFLMRCSTGTYVRILADDLARALGGRAHLASLRRTAIGSLLVDDAHPPDEITPAEWRDLLLTPAAGLADLPAVEVGEDLMRAIGHGVAVAGHELGNPVPGPVRMLDAEGRLLAVYRSEGAKASAEVVLS